LKQEEKQAKPRKNDMRIPCKRGYLMNVTITFLWLEISQPHERGAKVAKTWHGIENYHASQFESLGSSRIRERAVVTSLKVKVPKSGLFIYITALLLQIQ
jgi:hypothetical protein